MTADLNLDDQNLEPFTIQHCKGGPSRDFFGKWLAERFMRGDRTMTGGHGED